MKTIKKIKTSMFEIAQILASDELLQKLLVIDSPNVLQIEIYTPKTLNEMLDEQYICLAPKLENALKKNDRNTFLIIQLDTGDLRNASNMRIAGSIFIATDGDHILLKNNANRLWEILDRIIQDLDERKLSSAGAISVDTFNHVVYSEYTFGYRVNFSFKDQENRKAEL